MRAIFRALLVSAVLLVQHGWVGAAVECPPAAAPLTPELFATAAKQASDRGALWSITRDDRVSYLYGTLHVGRSEWMAPGPKLRTALQQTDVLALELDPLDAGIRADVAEAASQVKRNLPAPLKARLKAAWEAQCLPAAALGADPSELQVLSLMFAAGRREGLDPTFGSEILLSLIARVLQRPVVSLESAAAQMRALLGQDDAEAIHFIEDSLDHIERGSVQQVLMQTARVWERGDLAQLERYPEWCECLGTDAERKFMARVLDDRNPVLADRIDQLHQEGKRVLAGVGALHMVGPKGLPALLGQRGYRVQRLN
jgi:uncharacterized protein